MTGSAAFAQTPDASDWGYYGGDTFGQRFSSLNEINRKNVTHLSVAWTYRTGENGAGFARANKLSFEATPVLRHVRQAAYARLLGAAPLLTYVLARVLAA